MSTYLDQLDTLYSFGFFPPAPQTYGIAGILAIVIGALFGFRNRSSKTRAMRTIAQAVEARRYLESGGMSLRRDDDVFLHTTVTRTRRVKAESSGGGGGGHSSFSSGYSSSGGGSFSGGGRSF